MPDWESGHFGIEASFFFLESGHFRLKNRPWLMGIRTPQGLPKKNPAGKGKNSAGEVKIRRMRVKIR